MAGERIVTTGSPIDGVVRMSLTERERKVCDAIAARRERMLRELADDVATPTGTGHAPGIDEYRGGLLERLTALGADVRWIEGDPRPDWLWVPPGREAAVTGGVVPPATAVATRVVGGRAPTIMIAGHVDTVHDPRGDFRELTVSADRRTATGPGAADMKGGILVAITALECLAETGHDLPWTMLLNADEETGSFHSANALREVAATHAYGLALEPALPDGSLVIERMGTGMFHLAARGRSAHVGRDFASGVSAVYALARAISRIEALVDIDAGRLVSVGPLRGTEVVNAIPDLAECWGNARFRNADAADAIGRGLDALATAADAMPSVTVHSCFSRPAKPCTPEVRRLAEAARAVAESLDQQLPFAATGGVCDGNIMQEVGLPTIDTLGVRGGNLHRTDEFVELASLVERAQLFAVLLLRLSS